jgi:hypothetical protein
MGHPCTIIKNPHDFFMVFPRPRRKQDQRALQTHADLRTPSCVTQPRRLQGPCMNNKLRVSSQHQWILQLRIASAFWDCPEAWLFFLFAFFCFGTRITFYLLFVVPIYSIQLKCRIGIRDHHRLSRGRGWERDRNKGSCRRPTGRGPVGVVVDIRLQRSGNIPCCSSLVWQT